MPNTPQRQRFQIPDVIDPPNTVCLTMTIPDDPIHIANITGAIYQIAFGPNYTDDDAHSAKALVQVWRRYFSTLTIGDCPVPCPPGLMGGLLEDFEMPLRVDCDCNVWVTCCDGTEKQLLTADQVKKLLVSQPGQDAPQAKPGTCQDYTGTMQANNKWYIPTLLNAGDTVSIEQALGITNDGFSIAWRDYKGNVILGPFNTGGQRMNTTDELPTAWHQGLLINLAGTPYAVYDGFTVPGGVTNAEAYLEINCQTRAIMSGSLDLQVKVCNNQVSTWSHTFDFTASPQGWQLDPIPPTQVGANGHWVEGAGWEASYTQFMTSNAYTILEIHSPIVPTFQCTGVSIFKTPVAGNTSGPVQTDSVSTIHSGVGTARLSAPYVSVGANPWTASFAATPVEELAFSIFVASEACNCDPGGSLVCPKFVVTGTGTDPF